MLKKLWVTLLFLLSSAHAFAIDYYWVGGTNGTWNAAANWSTTLGGPGGAIVPGTGDRAIFEGTDISSALGAQTGDITVVFILPNTVVGGLEIVNFNPAERVTFTTSLTTATFLNVAFTFNHGAGQSLQLVGGSASPDAVFCLRPALGSTVFNINGSIETTHLAGPTTGYGRLSAFRAGTQGIINFLNGSSYIHNVNGDSIPRAAYNGGSVVRVTGISDATAFAHWGATTFGDFAWDCTGQSGNFSIDQNLTMEKFDLNATGTGTLDLAVTAPRQLTVQGDVNLLDGLLRLSSGGGSPGRLRVEGNFLQPGGTLDVQGGSQLQLLNTLSQTGSTAAITSSSGIGQIAFIGTSNANFEVAGFIGGSVSVLIEKSTPTAQVELNSFSQVMIAGLHIKMGILNFFDSYPQNLRVNGLLQLDADGSIDMRDADHILRPGGGITGLTDAKLLVTTSGPGENSMIDFVSSTIQTIPALSVYRTLGISHGMKLLAGNVTANALEIYSGSARLGANNLIVAGGIINYPENGFVQTNGSGRLGVFFNVAQPAQEIRLATIAGSPVTISMGDVATAGLYYFRVLEPAAVGLFPPDLNSDYANFEMEIQAPSGAGTVPANIFSVSYPTSLNVGTAAFQQLYVLDGGTWQPFPSSVFVGLEVFLGASNFTVSENVRKYAIFRNPGLVVNSTADTPDANPGDGICDDGTGNCTLRAAIEEANALPGLDQIRFNIAGVGPHTILLTSDLPDITEQVVIDGYSQPGAVPNTNPIGLPNNAVIKIEINRAGAAVSNGLRLAAADIEVKGLSITNQSGAAISIGGLDVADCKVTGCFIGIRPDNSFLPNEGDGVVISGFINSCVVGDGTPAGMNVIEIKELTTGVLINNSFSNQVLGNYIGTDATGTNSFSNFGIGVRIIGGSSSGNNIGNGNEAQRNVIAGLDAGIVIDGSGTGNNVKGNYIGTNAAGNGGISTGVGISIANSGDQIIGRSFDAETGNLISGINGTAINLGSGASGIYIWGNAIGVAANRVDPLGNLGSAVLMDDNCSFNQVGGGNPWQGNIIANNLSGIVIGNLGLNIGNRILHNRIYNNTGDGIVLDIGANNDKTAPAINSILATATDISGTGDDGDLIQLFTNNGFASPNTAEGRLLIGETFVSGGVWTIPFAPVPGHRYTATGTDGLGNTSPFSAPQILTSGIFVVNTTTDSPDINPGDGICDDGTSNCSLRAAVQEANASPGVNSIHFNIPGAGPHIIAHSPFISDRVVINGYTQPGSTPATGLLSPANIQIEIQGTMEFGVQTVPFSSDAGNSEVLGVSVASSSGNEVTINPGIGNVKLRGNYIGRSADATLVSSAITNRLIIRGDNNAIGGSNIAERNLIGGGVVIEGSNNRLQGNHIAVRPNATDIDIIPSFNAGITINGNNNIIGGMTLGMPNLIGGAQVGIRVQTGTGNNFRGNRIFCNELAAAELSPGGNNDILPPDVQFFGGGGTNPFLRLEGNAAPFDTVTVYRDNSVACTFTTAPRQARDIIATTIADSEGSWSVSLPGVSRGDRLAVSATDGSGNTSPFVQLPAFRLTSASIPDQGVPPGTLRHVLTQFALENITQGPAAQPDFVEVNIPFRGTYTGGTDVSQFEWYQNSANDFSTATVVNAAFPVATGTGEDITFPAPTSIIINPGDTRYFWITADIDPLATNGETVRIGVMRKNKFGFNGAASIVGIDSLPAQGLQTICSLPLPAVSVTIVPVVGGTAELTASAVGVTNFRWYDVPTGGTPLATNTGLFITPPVLVTTTFYVSSYDPVLSCESSREAVIVTPLGIVAPTVQATAVTAANITSGSADLNWTNGNGTHRLAVITDDLTPITPPADNTSYTANAVYSGSGNQVVFNGNTTGPVTVTGLLPGSRYTLQVFEYNESLPNISYNTTSDTGNPLDFYTLATEPLNPPTNLVLTPVSGTEVTGIFDPPATPANGYLVLRRLTGDPQTPPVDGQAVNPGGIYAGQMVVALGPNVTFTDTYSITPLTGYTYDVYAYNGNAFTWNYLTSPVLSANVVTLGTTPEPVSQPAPLTVTNITATSATGNVNFTTACICSGYLATVRPLGTPEAPPQDGEVYTLGSFIAPNVRVVYQGNANSFFISNLLTDTDYIVSVYALNGTGTATNYLISPSLSVNFKTAVKVPDASPTALVFSGITDRKIEGAFTPSFGGANGYLVIRRPKGSTRALPQDGRDYAPGSVPAPDHWVVAQGNVISFIADGLQAATEYTFDVYAYNGNGTRRLYRTADPLSGDAATLATQPAAPPTDLRFTQRTKFSLGGEFTESLPAPANYLITIRLPDTPPFVPEDGKSYNVGETFGGVRIIGINNTRQFSAAQLEADTRYAVDVYAFNGQDKTANYLPNALTGIGRTLPFTPILQNIAPAFVIAESGATTLTLSGQDFLPGAVVRWNGGIRLSTTFVSNGQLQAFIPPELIANIGTAQISVANSADAVPAPELISENKVFEIRAGVNIGFAGVAAGNVDPNTDKHPLYAVNLFARGQAQVLQSLQLRTEGTFTAQDLKANGIRLWLSSNPSYDPQDRELAAVPAIGAGNTLTFSNLNLSLQRSVNVFLIVTADIAVQAQAGRTLRIGATSQEQFVLANNQIAKTGLNPLPAGGTQTVNSAQVNNPVDIERLRRLYNATGGDNWREKWNFNDPPGTWYGVEVENGEVVSIDLSGNNLSGDLAAAFEANMVTFSKLRYLNLSGNRLSGNFPQWVLNLEELEYLDLSRNNFSGTVPDAISRLQRLITLILSDNQFDRISEQIGALANLEALLMDNNRLIALPDALARLQKLRILIVRNNSITRLPDLFASLPQLRYLDVSFNRLTGLPASISRLTLLEVFLFHNNEISDLPPMDALRRLQKLYAYSNKLDFTDVLPLMPLFRPIDFVYAPQARIGTPQIINAEQGSSFTLEIRTGGNGNRYRWLRNSGQVSITSEPLLAINSATAAQSGIYTVEVTNPEAPALTLLSTEYDVRLSCGSSVTGINTNLTVSGGLNFCEGEAILVQLSAARNQNVVELLWLKDGQGIGGATSLNFTAREPGTYAVRMLTEGGCTVVSESITIRRNPAPVVRVRNENGRMTAEVSGEVVSYQWFKDNVQIADANRSQFEPTESGFYRVRITDRNGCTAISEPEGFNVTALPAVPVWASELRVYPNPSVGGVFQVKFPTAMLRQSREAHTLRITDLQGREVFARQLTANDLLFDTQLNLEAQPSGVYLLHIETPEGLIVRKLVKK